MSLEMPRVHEPRRYARRALSDVASFTAHYLYKGSLISDVRAHVG